MNGDSVNDALERAFGGDSGSQAKLYKVADKDREHYIAAVPDQHWTKGLDEKKLESVAWAAVPPRTEFTKVPNWQVVTSKEDMIEALREQKEYWEKQMFGIQADNLNGFDTQEECDKAVEKFKRYEKRVEACSIFIQNLVEHPLHEDKEVVPTWKKVEIEDSDSNPTDGENQE